MHKLAGLLAITVALAIPAPIVVDLRHARAMLEAERVRAEQLEREELEVHCAIYDRWTARWASGWATAVGERDRQVAELVQQLQGTELGAILLLSAETGDLEEAVQWYCCGYQRAPGCWPSAKWLTPAPRAVGTPWVPPFFEACHEAYWFDIAWNMETLEALATLRAALAGRARSSAAGNPTRR